MTKPRPSANLTGRSTIGVEAAPTEVDLTARLQRIISDPTSSDRDVLDAHRLLRRVKADAAEDDDRTLNRLTRAELEGLASRLASQYPPKPLTDQG